MGFKITCKSCEIQGKCSTQGLDFTDNLTEEIVNAEDGAARVHGLIVIVMMMMVIVVVIVG